jgi:hypothetical protein
MRSVRIVRTILFVKHFIVLQVMQGDAGVPCACPARNTAVPGTRAGTEECRSGEATEATNSLRKAFPESSSARGADPVSKSSS